MKGEGFGSCGVARRPISIAEVLRVIVASLACRRPPPRAILARFVVELLRPRESRRPPQTVPGSLGRRRPKSTPGREAVCLSQNAASGNDAALCCVAWCCVACQRAMFLGGRGARDGRGSVSSRQVMSPRDAGWQRVCGVAMVVARESSPRERFGGGRRE